MYKYHEENSLKAFGACSDLKVTQTQFLHNYSPMTFVLLYNLSNIEDWKHMKRAEISKNISEPPLRDFSSSLIWHSVRTRFLNENVWFEFINVLYIFWCLVDYLIKQKFLSDSYEKVAC